MSRKISLRLREVLKRSLVKPFILIKLGPFYDSSNILQTTDMTDTIFNGETYSCEATLSSLDTPTITSGIDKGSFNIQLIDKDYWFRNKFVHGVTGTKAELRGVFIDMELDEPLLNPEDTMIIYKGIINSYSYNISKETLPIVSIELSSPMGSLTLVRSLVTSQDWMRQKYPTDTSYDHIFEGSKSAVLKWGRV